MTRNARAKKQKIQRWLSSPMGFAASSAIENTGVPPSPAITPVAIAPASISSEPTSVYTTILIVAGPGLIDPSYARPGWSSPQPANRKKNGISIRSKKRTKRSRSWAMNAPSVAVCARPSRKNHVLSRSGVRIAPQQVTANHDTPVSSIRKTLIPSMPSE